MKIIGITGGAGAGKTMILDYLHREYQATICQADQVARHLQKKGTKCYAKVVEHFGTGILMENNRIDRGKLAGIVFADDRERAVLNAIIHPAVKQRILQLIQEAEKKHTSLFILEAALLIEENYSAVCDELWYIHAGEDVRRKRLKASRGYSDKKIDDIFAAQLPQKSFLEQCDRAIDNEDTFEETYEQLDKIIEQLNSR